MPKSQALTGDSVVNLLPSLRLIATDMDGTLTIAGEFTPSLLHAFGDLADVGIAVLIVTGRSAGWVQGLVHYLPIVGAIAENGGVYFSKQMGTPIYLTEVPDITQHRQALANTFHRLRHTLPHLHESSDNRFRLTDWTFDVEGLTPENLAWLQAICESEGWSFTYSTVQCHIKPAQQDKAQGLQRVLLDHFPEVTCEHLLTVGDSPNDESLFNPAYFPYSVGVANVRHYLSELTHHPTYITQAEAGEGFGELVQRIMSQRRI